MKKYLNKKILLFIGLIVLGARVMCQDEPENTKPQTDVVINEAVPKSVSQKEKIIEFKSQKEKEQKIALLEAVIKDRLAQGRTMEDLSGHYKALERTKNAVIKSPEKYEN